MISQLAFTIAATIYNCMLNIFEISLFLLKAAAEIPMRLISSLSLLLTKCLQTVCSSILKLSCNASIIAINVMLNVFSILHFILINETFNFLGFFLSFSYFITTNFLKAGSFLLENISSITIGMRDFVFRIVDILRTTDLSEQNNSLSSRNLPETDSLIFPEEIVEKETSPQYKQGSINTGILITNLGCGKEITITCERNKSDQSKLSSENSLDCKSKTEDASVSPKKSTYLGTSGKVKDYKKETSLSLKNSSEQSLEQSSKSNSSPDLNTIYSPEETKSFDSLKLDFSKSTCSYSFNNKEIPDYSNILKKISSEEIERSTYYTEKRRKTESEEYVPLWHDNKDDSLRRHKSIHRRDLDILAKEDENNENASSFLSCESQTIMNSKESGNEIEICTLQNANQTEHFASDSGMKSIQINSLEVEDCFKVVKSSETGFKDLVDRDINLKEEINALASTVSSVHLSQQNIVNKSISVEESNTEEKNEETGVLVFLGNSKTIGDAYQIPDSNEKLIDNDTENTGTIDEAFKFLDEETIKSSELEEITGEEVDNEIILTGHKLVSLIPMSVAAETAVDCCDSSLYDEVSSLPKVEMKLDVLSNIVEFTENENSNKSISVPEITEDNSSISCDKVSTVDTAETLSRDRKLMEIEDIDAGFANTENKSNILLNEKVDIIQEIEKTQLIASTLESETNLESNELINSNSVEYDHQCVNKSENISIDTNPSKRSETNPKMKFTDFGAETNVVSSGEDSTEIIKTNNILQDEMSVITIQNDDTDKNFKNTESFQLGNEGTRRRMSIEEFSKFLSISEFDDVFISLTDESSVEKIVGSETTQENLASCQKDLSSAINDTEVKEYTPQCEKQPLQINEDKDGMSFSITDKINDAVLLANEKEYSAQNFEQNEDTQCIDRCSVAVELEENCDAEYELNISENCESEDYSDSDHFSQQGLCNLKLEKNTKDFMSSKQLLNFEVGNESNYSLVETTTFQDLDQDLMRKKNSKSPEVTLEQSENFQNQSFLGAYEEKPLQLSEGEQQIESLKDINCSSEDGNVQELENSKEGTINNEQKTTTSKRKKKNRRRRKH